MLLIILFTIIHMSAAIRCEQQILHQAPLPPINVNCTLNTHYNPNNTLSNTVVSQTMQTIQNTMTMTSILSALKEQAQEIRENILSFALNHTLFLLAGTASIFYVMLNYRLSSLNARINKHIWSNWHNNMTMDQLKVLPCDTLSQELLLEIQEQYQNVKALTNFLMPLMTFLTDVDKEFIELQTYVFWYERFNTLKISSLFFIDETTLRQCPERMERLAFLKKLFMRWVAQYTLAINVPKDYTEAQSLHA